MMEITSGLKIDSYEVLESLGRGGNCQVFKARNVNTSQIVALKALIEPKNVMRFRREFRSMARLDHPNIARVFDIGTFKSTAYFTMEYIDGGDLRSKIRTGGEDAGRKVPKTEEDFRDLVRLFVEICQPLKYIHARKIVHRDLKPANIMLTADGRIKLMDFGLIKELGIIHESLTQTGIFVGTVNYMSPEQGLCRPLDHRSDIYSLGVIFYEMLAGRLPFIGSSIMEMFMMHIQQPPRPIHEYNPKVPVILDKLVLGMLNKQPHGRPDSMSEIIHRLENFLYPDREKRGTAEISILEETMAAPTFITKEQPTLFNPGFIGREDILLQMKTAITDISRHPHSAIIIAGETGVGKSALLNEVGINVRMNGWGFIQGSCSPLEQFPYSAFLRPLEVIADRLRQRETADCERILAGKGPILAKVCPRFSAIDIVQAQPAPEPLEPLQEKLRTFDSIKTLLKNLAAERPILLTLDDLQWADGLSLELFHFLVRDFELEIEHAPVPILLIATYRPEEVRDEDALNPLLDALKSFRHVLNILLKPLEKSHIREMIRLMLGIDDLHPELVDIVFRESGGNPFFVEEILKGFIDRHVLVKEFRQWIFSLDKLKDSVPEIGDKSITSSVIPVSEKIQDIISRRLEGLDKTARNILTRAAVIGMRFDFDVLASVIREDEDTLLDFLDAALNEKLIEEIPGFGGRMYRFHHQMIRNVLYFSLHNRRRIRIHKNVAETIERIYDTNKPETWEILAYHYDKAQQYEKALEYYVKAAQYNIFSHNVHPARSYSSRAITLLDEIKPEREKWLRFMKDAYHIHGLSSEFLGKPEEAFDDYQQIIHFGEQENDNNIISLGYTFTGDLHAERGELDAAMQAYEKVLEYTDESPGNQYYRALRKTYIANVLRDMGKLNEALAVYMEVKSVLEQKREIRDLALCNSNIGLIYYYLGDYEKAFQLIRKSTEQYREANYLHNLSRTLSNLAGIYLAHGKIPQSQECLEEALEISRKLGDIHSIAAIQGNLGLAYIVSGKYALAGESFREYLRISRNIANQTGLCVALLNMGILLQEEGERDSPLEYFNEALEISKCNGIKWLTSYAYLNIGELMNAEKRWKEAVENLEKACEISREIGIKLIEILSQASMAWAKIHTGESGSELKERVETCCREALELGESDSVLLSHFRLAQINLKRGDTFAARIAAARGLKFARKWNHMGYQWRFLAWIGYSLKADGRLRHAWRCFREARNILAFIGKNIDADLRSLYFKQEEIASVLAIYREMFRQFESSVTFVLDATVEKDSDATLEIVSDAVKSWYDEQGQDGGERQSPTEADTHRTPGGVDPSPTQT